MDVNIRGERGSKVIEIYADTDAGITVDQCAELSRRISVALDVENIMPGSYRLEVSSPGLDHSLKLLRQYKKNIGRQLKITARIGSEVSSSTGILEHVGDTDIMLKTANGTITLSFDTVLEAFVIPKLSR